MAPVIDFYFAFASPYAYLASTQLRAIADRFGVEINYIPFNVLGVMKLTGNTPTSLQSPEKAAYVNMDLARWAGRYQVPLKPGPHMKKSNWPLMAHGAVVANARGEAAAYVHALYPAVWASAADLADPAVIQHLLDDAGLAGAEILAAAANPDVEAQIEANTVAAAKAGVFGAPTCVFNGQMFFGNDRLDWLVEALEKEGAAA